MKTLHETLDNLRKESFAVAVDAHTAGEPIRVILDGYDEELERKQSMPQRQRWIKNNDDELRTRTMREPRGHAAMFGAIVMEPPSEEADAGVLFPYPSGYADMCGHGSMGVATILLELGLIEPDRGENEVKLETPAGLVRTVASYGEGKVDEVQLFGTPSFFSESVDVELAGRGTIGVDLSYGGNFFGIVRVDELGLSLNLNQLGELNSVAHEIMEEINEMPDVMLERPEMGPVPLERIRFVGGEENEKNVVIHEGAVIDRSPCGTGTCSQLAWEYHRGDIGKRDVNRYRSIIDTEFRGEVVREETTGGRTKILPRVTGSSYITGVNYFLTSSGDPLANGFSVSHA